MPLHVAPAPSAVPCPSEAQPRLRSGSPCIWSVTWIPHDDIPSPNFELWSGLAALTTVAIVRGPLDAATIGAAAASSPDLEHLLRLPRPGGRKLFQRATAFPRSIRPAACSWTQLLTPASSWAGSSDDSASAGPGRSGAKTSSVLEDMVHLPVVRKREMFLVST